VIPITLGDKIEYLCEGVIFYLRPLDPYVRARIDDTVTELKGMVTAGGEAEVKINWSLARYLYVQFGLAGWDWEHAGKLIEFRKRPLSKWGKDYEVASDESIKLLQMSSLEAYNRIADAIRDNAFLQEEEAKNSNSPSAASGQD